MFSRVYQNLPMFLTMSRIVVPPLLLTPLLATYLPGASLSMRCFLALIFLLCAFTDLLDGYAARRLGTVTHTGMVLDPIADKILVYSACLALVVVGLLHYAWMLLLLVRDLLVSGFRSGSAELQRRLAPCQTAKVKSALLTLAIALLIIGGPDSVARLLGFVGLLVVLALSLFSGYRYGRSFFRYFSVVER